MIAVQIADFFVLKRDVGKEKLYLPNLVVWLIGFILYRILMQMDIPVGNTLPDMVLTILVCVIASKVERKK